MDTCPNLFCTGLNESKHVQTCPNGPNRSKTYPRRTKTGENESIPVKTFQIGYKQVKTDQNWSKLSKPIETIPKLVKTSQNRSKPVNTGLKPIKTGQNWSKPVANRFKTSANWSKPVQTYQYRSKPSKLVINR